MNAQELKRQALRQAWCALRRAMPKPQAEKYLREVAAGAGPGVWTETLLNEVVSETEKEA